jgi:hypothetical protein
MNKGCGFNRCTHPNYIQPGDWPMVFAVRPVASCISSELDHSGPIIPCGMRLVEAWSVASTAGGEIEFSRPSWLLCRSRPMPQANLMDRFITSIPSSSRLLGKPLRRHKGREGRGFSPQSGGLQHHNPPRGKGVQGYGPSLTMLLTPRQR